MQLTKVQFLFQKTQFVEIVPKYSYAFVIPKYSVRYIKVLF